MTDMTASRMISTDVLPVGSSCFKDESGSLHELLSHSPVPNKPLVSPSSLQRLANLYWKVGECKYVITFDYHTNPIKVYKAYKLFY